MPGSKDRELITSGTAPLGIGEEALLIRDYNMYYTDSIPNDLEPVQAKS